MSPDDPGGDWSMPPVEPAAPLGNHSRLPSASPRTPPAPLPSNDARPRSVAALDEPPLQAPAPLPPTDIPRRNPVSEPVSPMRAMAGALVAVAGVLLGIGALLWATDSPDGDPTLAGTSRTTAESPSTLPSPVPSPSPVVSAPAVVAAPSVGQSSPAAATRPEAVPKLPLTVLNNSNRTGLADRAARRFRAGGWPIKLTGNFTGRVSETTVYYAPGQLRSAQLLQRSFAGLTRVRPRFESLPGSGLTVVLTRSFDA
jgi:hypothetical protein